MSPSNLIFTVMTVQAEHHVCTRMINPWPVATGSRFRNSIFRTLRASTALAYLPVNAGQVYHGIEDETAGHSGSAFSACPRFYLPHSQPFTSCSVPYRLFRRRDEASVLCFVVSLAAITLLKKSPLLYRLHKSYVPTGLTFTLSTNRNCSKQVMRIP